MPLKSEMVTRAKTLHRRAWINAPTMRNGMQIPRDDILTVGPVTIWRAGEHWIVSIIEGRHERIIYREQPDDGIFVRKELVPKALQHLRAAMILDDLANV